MNNFGTDFLMCCEIAALMHCQGKLREQVVLKVDDVSTTNTTIKKKKVNPIFLQGAASFTGVAWYFYRFLSVFWKTGYPILQVKCLINQGLTCGL